MQFTAADISAMLQATGQDISVLLYGAAVKTIRAKFRKNWEMVSPYESNVGSLLPGFICATADLTGLGNNHTYLIDGCEYVVNGPREEMPNGFSRVSLGVKL